MRGMRSVVGYFGWWSFILLILAVAGFVGWWRWDQGRQLPLPPQAQGVSSEIIGALAKRTTFAVPSTIDEMRAFYQEVLPQRGWSYCGTQATPGCTNLAAQAGAPGEDVDVYRRAGDQQRTGTTIEVWATQRQDGGTQVSVYEANPAR